MEIETQLSRYYCVGLSGSVDLCSLLGTGIPWNKNVANKEDEEIINYSPLVREIKKLHQISAKVVLLVVGCFGVVSCRLEHYLKELGIPDVLSGMQISAVVETTHILQRILGVGCIKT